MRKLVVSMFVSLDGVMQAPGGSEEDTLGGFSYGGWAMPYLDESFDYITFGGLSAPFDLLLGWKTYEIFAGYWPQQTGVVADLFNKASKYVVANHALDLTWEESILIHDNVAAEIKALKEKNGPMLQVHGSGVLVQTLFKNDLVDELRLAIIPVTLGCGKRLFRKGIVPTAFELTKCEATSSGAIIAHYKTSAKLEQASS